MLNMQFPTILGLITAATLAANAHAQSNVQDVPTEKKESSPRWVVPFSFINHLQSSACSPCEKWIVNAHLRDIRIFKAGTSKPMAVIPRTTYSSKVCFSPTQADTFAVGDSEGTVFVYRIGETEPHLTFKLDKESKFRITGLKYSPDGEQISLTGRNFRNCEIDSGVYTTRDSTTGEKIFGQVLDNSGVTTLSYSPDGSQLAIAVNDDAGSHIRILSAENGEEVRSIDFDGFANSILFTPDSSRLIMLGGRGYPTPPDSDYGVMIRTVGHFWITDLTSNNPPRQFAHEKGYYQTGVMTKDGKAFLAQGESTFQLWSLEPSRLLWSREREGDRQRLLLYSSDLRSAVLNKVDYKTSTMTTSRVAIPR